MPDAPIGQTTNYAIKKWAEGANTGGITMVPNPLPDASSVVRAHGLDYYLEEYGVPQLIKLDCEGAEWPGLMTSRRLGELPELLGEYHEVGGDYDHHDGRVYNLPYDHLTVKNLEHHLRTVGHFDRFESTRHHYEHYNPVLKRHFNLSWLGHFWAWRE